MSASPRTVTVTVLVKDRLQRLFQQHRRRGLGNAIRRIRHAERPDPQTMIFWYLHRAHRSREIASRRHPVPQPVEVVPLPPAEFGDTHGIHARRAPIGPDLLPRPVDQALIDLKRLHLRLGSSRRLLPERVGHPSTLVRSAPWLQDHYSPFIATTSRPAPVPRIGTPPLAVSAPRGSPFRGQATTP
jgi:hypothetical protein